VSEERKDGDFVTADDEWKRQSRKLGEDSDDPEPHEPWRSAWNESDEEWATVMADYDRRCAEWKVRQAPRIRQKRIERLRKLRFPARHLALLTGEVAETTAMGLARKYATGDRTGLVLIGGTGCGKTTAASWLALEHGGDYPGFITAAELEKYGRYHQTMQTWLSERTLLVIDDLGAEYADAKGNFVSLLDGLIDELYGDMRRFVITSNQDAKQITARYGARIASRLSECGVLGQCGTTDLRRTP